MMNKSILFFHETFKPELVYISKILKLASEKYSGTKIEISERTGIPTGKEKGKVVPHIKYASFMGLIEYTCEKGVFSLCMTKLGQEVFLQDPYLHESLTCWICHYCMTRKKLGAQQWSYLLHDAWIGLGEEIKQDRLFVNVQKHCDVELENMSKTVFSVVKSSYTNGCFESLQYLRWDDSIEFYEQVEQLELLFVYAYALFDSWDQIYPDKRELTETDLKTALGFNKVFGFNEEECGYVIDSLSDEGLLTVNRQLYPATIIRTTSTEWLIPQIYSRLL